MLLEIVNFKLVIRSIVNAQRVLETALRGDLSSNRSIKRIKQVPCTVGQTRPCGRNFLNRKAVNTIDEKGCFPDANTTCIRVMLKFLPQGRV